MSVAERNSVSPAADESVVEDHAPGDAELLRSRLEHQTIRPSCANMWMSGTEHDATVSGVNGENGRQGLDDVLDTLSRDSRPNVRRTVLPSTSAGPCSRHQSGRAESHGE